MYSSIEGLRQVAFLDEFRPCSNQEMSFRSRFSSVLFYCDIPDFQNVGRGTSDSACHFQATNMIVGTQPREVAISYPPSTSFASVGRKRFIPGMVLNLADSSTGWCVGLSSPTPMESCSRMQVTPAWLEEDRRITFSMSPLRVKEVPVGEDPTQVISLAKSEKPLSLWDWQCQRRRFLQGAVQQLHREVPLVVWKSHARWLDSLLSVH